MGIVVSTGTLIDRLNAVRDLFGEVITELERVAELMPPAETLAAADGIETVSRQTGYAQLLIAKTIDEQVFADPQNPGRSEFRNCAAFLQSRLRINRSEARRRLTVAAAVLPGKSLTGEPLDAKYRLFGSLAAHSVAGLPALNTAVIALEAATVKTRSNTELHLLELMEASLAEAITDQDPDFLTPLINRWDTLIDQDGSVPDENELRHRQGLFRRETRRGLTRFELWADQIQTETLLTVVHAGSNPRAGEAKGRSLDKRTHQQQQLDTLVSALGQAFRHRMLPQTGGQAAQLTVTIDYSLLAGQLANSGKATLQFTGPVQPKLIRRLACEAGIIPIVLAADGEVLDVGRKRRLFSTPQRTALAARDKGCTFPSCTIPAGWCEAHHIHPWQHGGVTSINNGTLLCSYHHHLIHLGHWRIDPMPLEHPDPPAKQNPRRNPAPYKPKTVLPRFIPPRWVDPQQSPRQNQLHQL